MSKIALTPNPSGTGVFTIASPATNTDRTLTLPDEAGTVLTSASSLASANLTGTVTVSGANVGIGVVPDAADGSYLQFANGYFTGQNGFGRNTYFDGSNYKAIYTGGATIIQGGDDFLFYTAASVSADANQTFVERCRIDSSGNLLVGVSTNTYLARSYVKQSGNNPVQVIHGSASVSSVQMVKMYSNNGGTNNLNYALLSDGDLENRNGSYGTLTSDVRLKENIVPATPKLADMLALDVVNFNLIGQENKMLGFKAHQMREVFPALVKEKDTREYDEAGNVTSGYEDQLSVRVGMEFAFVVKAIQEQQAIITAQQTTIDAMEIRLAALEAV